MSNSSIQTSSRSGERQQIYVFGAVAGLLFGLLSAYMFNRASGDGDLPPGAARQVKTTDLIGLGLAALGLVRQITELGRPDQKQGRRK